MFVSPAIRRLTVLGIFGGGLIALSAACSEPAPPPPPAPKVLTAAERVARYQECWGYFNDKAWDKFQDCYTDNAVSESVDSMPASVSGRAAIVQNGKDAAMAFPDRRGELKMVLANPGHIVGVALWTGTNTGDMPPGPDGKPVKATNKPIGLLMAHTLEWDSTGTMAARDAGYVDEGTIQSQLGLNPNPSRPVEKATGAPAMVVIAKGDDTEKQNVAAAQTVFDALNKHDLKALEATMADNYKGIAVAEPPPDKDKKAAIAGTKEMFAAFPDVKITPVSSWAAGDYVVVTGTFEGTNTGDMPSMKMKKTGNKVSAHFLEIFQFDKGKVTNDWLFYNGAAFATQLMAPPKK